MGSVRTIDRLTAGNPAMAGSVSARCMAAFCAAHRASINALVVQSPALADLAESFPGLLFALATGYGATPAREAAMQGVIGGAPLRDVASALSLPMWLRHLPADAFSTPLPELPAAPEFAGRIIDLMPQRRELAAAWLDRVIYAARAANPEVALWTARLHRSQTPLVSAASLRYLMVWAWYADQPGTIGHALLRRPWSPALGIARALEDSDHWRRRIALAVCLGEGTVDTWVDGGSALGYDIVPLRTAAEFLAESIVMNNCLDQFADHMETGASRVFSIRKAGRPVADVEIGIRDHHVGMPSVLQVRASRNRLAGPDIWRAVYTWLGSQPLRMVMPDAADPTARQRHRRRILGPYLAQLPLDLRKEFETVSARVSAKALQSRHQPRSRLAAARSRVARIVA